MLPQFDKNAAFIWASYGLGVLMIGVTILTVMLKARAAKANLARLEATIREDTQG